MDNRKSFRRIVLLFIFIILLVLLSLMVSRMTDNGAQRSDETAAGQTEETLEGAQDMGWASPEEPENEEADISGEASPSGNKTDEAMEEARRKREEDERYAEYRRKLARESQKKEKDKEKSENGGTEEEKPKEEPYVPPTILIVSDLHYMSEMTHDDGEAFLNMMFLDDGKLDHCSDIILDALIDEAIARDVSAVVMAGDNTLNGELQNHEELAKKLERLKEAGIPVLLVPGNHDINDTNAALYFGDEAVEAEYLHSADEYYEIYEDFYEGANSRDPNSLSYVYPLDATHWMMLLDTAWYEDKMHVEGRVRPETLLWMEEVFDAANEVDALVIPVGHHNLLSESRYYTKECIMRNYDEVLELLERYDLPLYLSGHLHAQRIKKYKSQPGIREDEYGITEIVSSPISIAPCQYGILSWDDDDAMHYEVYSLVDHMDGHGNYIGAGEETEEDERSSQTSVTEEFADLYYIAEAESDDPSYDAGVEESIDLSYEAGAEDTIVLLYDTGAEESIDLSYEVMTKEDHSLSDNGEDETFASSAIAFTKGVISNQIAVNFPYLPEDIRAELGDSYADMYYLYTSGSFIDWDEFTRSPAYSLWQKYSRTDEYVDDMLNMARDNTGDYHSWDYPAPEKEDTFDAEEVQENITDPLDQTVDSRSQGF